MLLDCECRVMTCASNKTPFCTLLLLLLLLLLLFVRDSFCFYWVHSVVSIESCCSLMFVGACCHCASLRFFQFLEFSKTLAGTVIFFPPSKFVAFCHFRKTQIFIQKSSTIAAAMSFVYWIQKRSMMMV
jgi:hypothetical protein